MSTTYQFKAPPEAVWQAMMFYEEVTARPPFLLRTFLPAPLRTRGDKTRLGATIECVYDGGYLEKEIMEVTPPRFVSFDVRIQKLGIEDCITMNNGSYRLRAEGGGSEVVLTTCYCGHLLPRLVWRPFERYLSRRMHRHILDGMREALEHPRRVVEAVAVEQS